MRTTFSSSFSTKERHSFARGWGSALSSARECLTLVPRGRLAKPSQKAAHFGERHGADRGQRGDAKRSGLGPRRGLPRDTWAVLVC